MKRVTIQIFDDAVSAHLLRVRLESDGIECFIEDEHIVTMNPLFNYAVGGIKLKVHETDVDRAIKIIGDINSKPSVDNDNDLVRCPNCGSTTFYSNFKSMRGIKGFLSAAFSFVFTLFPIYFKSVRKCKNCDQEF